MLRCETPLCIDAEILDEGRLGCLEAYLEGCRIYIGKGTGIAVAVLKAVPERLSEGLGYTHMIVEEYTILSREIHAIRPLHSLAEMNGVLCRICVHVIALCNVGLNLACTVKPEQTLLDRLSCIPSCLAVE